MLDAVHLETARSHPPFLRPPSSGSFTGSIASALSVQAMLAVAFVFRYDNGGDGDDDERLLLFFVPSILFYPRHFL